MFRKIILLLLAVASIYSAVSTPLPSEDGAAYLMGAIAGRIFFPVLFVYLAFRKKKNKK